MNKTITDKKYAVKRCSGKLALIGVLMFFIHSDFVYGQSEDKTVTVPNMYGNNILGNFLSDTPGLINEGWSDLSIPSGYMKPFDDKSLDSLPLLKKDASNQDRRRKNYVYAELLGCCLYSAHYNRLLKPYNIIIGLGAGIPSVREILEPDSDSGIFNLDVSQAVHLWSQYYFDFGGGIKHRPGFDYDNALKHFYLKASMRKFPHIGERADRLYYHINTYYIDTGDRRFMIGFGLGFSF
ncbi:MAG: hypothetical protein WD491_00055 [Balneolales bacterium]